MSYRETLAQWFQKYKYPLSIFFTSRVGLFLLVYLSLLFIPIRQGDGLWRGRPDNLVIDGWARWDSGWYASIIEKGYTNRASEQKERDTAFFPLYPLLARGLNYVLRDGLVSGLLIANGAFLISLLLLYRMVLEYYDLEVAQRTVAIMAFNPFSFLFSAVYTEALFLLGAVCAFYFAERRKWPWAALSVAATSATRIPGILTLIGVALLYLEQIRFDWRKIRADILWLPLSFTGLGSFMLYLWLQFDNPLQFIVSQKSGKGWGQAVSIELALLVFKVSASLKALVTGKFPAIELFHLLSFFFALAVLLLAIRRLRPAYSAWGLIALLISFSRFKSMGRMLIVIFPLYIALALLLKGKKFEYFLYVNILLLALFAIMFSHWYWVA